MALFILPTSGPRTYRGKYPTRIRSVSCGATGLHLELNNGTRLWSFGGGGNFPNVKPGYDFGPHMAAACRMTESQYSTLTEAAALKRAPLESTGLAPRMRERDARAGTIRRMLESIVPTDSQYAKRNAEGRRAEVMAEESPRYRFNPEKPFRVYNRGPWGSTCFDFPTIDEARGYLVAQAERRAFMTSGAAPVGPHGDSIDPLASFIIWPDGTETLAELGWTHAPDGGRLWIRAETEAAPAETTERLPAPPVRRDNVEYHAGRAAFDAGETPAAMPYADGGERAARWNLGYREAQADAAPAPALVTETARARYWRTQAGFVATLPGEALERDTGAGYARLDSLMRLKGESRETIDSALRAEVFRLETVAQAAPVRTIDCAPTWSGMVPAFRAVIHNGTSEGGRVAWLEIERMAALADERNRMAARIASALELLRGTRGGFDPGSNGRAAIDEILAALETVSGESN